MHLIAHQLCQLVSYPSPPKGVQHIKLCADLAFQRRITICLFDGSWRVSFPNFEGCLLFHIVELQWPRCALGPFHVTKAAIFWTLRQAIHKGVTGFKHAFNFERSQLSLQRLKTWGNFLNWQLLRSIRFVWICLESQLCCSQGVAFKQHTAKQGRFLMRWCSKNWYRYNLHQSHRPRSVQGWLKLQRHNFQKLPIL